MEVLSEHMCQGWLEGYLLTGRHGFFSCYEAFIHIVDSMFNQHAKWLKVTRGIPWRRPIASLNYLLTSHVWRQDHNGFSHQDPGFIDFVMNKKADIIRVYLPPDANCLLSVVDHCLRSRHYVNVIVAGKQPELQWLDMEAAIEHCTQGIGVLSWASADQGAEPDVVMACAGDVPTLETLAAVDLLRRHFSDIKIRVINVVDLMTLQPSTEHPHGLSDRDFDSMIGADTPIIFAYHGYPWLIHRLTYRRAGHDNLHVRGYKEEGTTTTPFDMTVMNDLDRYHLAGDVVDRAPRLQRVGAHFKQFLRDKLVAVFDTGFHRNMPPRAAVYPGPYEWFEDGIRRYGFHGINHQYCAARAAKLLRRDLASLKLVTCHLGAGCSLAAISEGRSIDTTMGFTPLEGLMMGSRSGSVDPGILTYLMRQRRLQAHEIDEMLNQKSGLLGISGISGDMREILNAMKQGHQRARLAFDIYAHRLQAGIGAMVAALGGIDALVFTAGVGENSPEVRSAACGKLEFLGLKLDEAANAQVSADEDVAAQDSRVRILVIRAQEEWAIAEECWKLTHLTANS